MSPVSDDGVTHVSHFKKAKIHHSAGGQLSPLSDDRVRQPCVTLSRCMPGVDLLPQVSVECIWDIRNLA